MIIESKSASSENCYYVNVVNCKSDYSGCNLKVKESELSKKPKLWKQ